MRLFILTGLCCAAFASASAQANQNTPVYGPVQTQPQEAPRTTTADENARYRLQPLPSYQPERVESECRLRIRPIRLKMTCNLAPQRR